MSAWPNVYGVIADIAISVTRSSILGKGGIEISSAVFESMYLRD